MIDMREILFKAKRKDNGEWVEGNLITNERNQNQKYIGYIFDERNGVIEDFDLVEVIPDTICQFTGLTDKNGKKIWENDIVSAWSEGKNAIGKVIRRADGLYIMYPAYQNKEFWGVCPNKNGKTTVEVIGNIFDNPELLEVE